MQFFIQSDSEISASTQLFDQLSFAITSCQYAAGEQLPSTRQLSAWTGLHRNTINKVYQQLKEAGLVESKGGSGVYVNSPSAMSESETTPVQTIRHAIDLMVKSGNSLAQVRDLFLTEIDWRLRCNAQILVASGQDDPGIAQIMATELQAVFAIPIQTVAIADLAETLEHSTAGTIVTNRYFLDRVQRATANHAVRIFAVDIYQYQSEIEKIRKLPKASHVGLVSISTGILRIAESLIHSLRGDELLVTTVLPQDSYRLQATARNAHIIIVDHSGKAALQEAIALTRDERIRAIEILDCHNYIAHESIEKLKLEMGTFL